jgi:hypothetical protein
MSKLKCPHCLRTDKIRYFGLYCVCLHCAKRWQRLGETAEGKLSPEDAEYCRKVESFMDEKGKDE